MKKTARPQKSPTHFQQVPVEVVRKIALAAPVKPANGGRGKPAVLVSRGEAAK
jgi:hypothetical protein